MHRLCQFSVGNTYSEYQQMHTFLDNFHQGGKYSAQIASHQVELRIKEKFTDQKSLSISSFLTDYLNFDSSSGWGRNIERYNLVQTKCTFMEVPITMQKTFSIGPERKSKKLTRLVIWTTDVKMYNSENFYMWT